MTARARCAHPESCDEIGNRCTRRDCAYYSADEEAALHASRARARDLSDTPASEWRAYVDSLPTDDGPEPDGSRYLGGGLYGPASR